MKSIRQLVLTSLFCVNLAAVAADARAPFKFRVKTADALFRLGVSPDNISARGKAAATLVWDAVDSNNADSASLAVLLYQDIAGKEFLGEDYTALQWFCEHMTASEAQKAAMVADKLTEEYFHFFADNDYAVLKEFLSSKYRLQSEKSRESEDERQNPKEQQERFHYLNDFIMFANPKRDDWELSHKVIPLLDLKQGDKIADIGCGFGFYSFKFSPFVGEEGRIYAVDISKDFLDFVYDSARKNGLRNVFTVHSRVDDILVGDKVDIVFVCSLYHVIYGWSREPDRRPFLESVVRALKKDGRLVIVDNLPAGGRELHNCYVTKELMEAQLHHYGFRLAEYHAISPMRQVAIFKFAAADAPLPGEPEGNGGRVIEIATGESLLYVGSAGPPEATTEGTRAAKLLYQALDQIDLDAAAEAIALYDKLIPTENFGADYTALKWFCEYLVAAKETRIQMVSDPLVRDYFDHLTSDRFRRLKQYVAARYSLSTRGSSRGGPPQGGPPGRSDGQQGPGQGQGQGPGGGQRGPGGGQGQGPGQGGPGQGQGPGDGQQSGGQGPGGGQQSPGGNQQQAQTATPPVAADGTGAAPAEGAQGKDGATSQQQPGTGNQAQPDGAQGDGLDLPSPGSDREGDSGRPRGDTDPKEQETFLENLILLNNPRRAEWEKTDKIMELLGIQEGQSVVDVGCGPGYYTYRLAQAVGEKGKVYALDGNQSQLKYIETFLKGQDISNVETGSMSLTDVGIAGPADVVFMCSLYHTVYGVSSKPDRESFVSSIKKALKKGGTLCIVDSGPVTGTDLPYYGEFVAKELVIAQLEHFGFTFLEAHQIIPQRYLLKFRL